jgi:frataxin-like iron-binding protein CyaY
VNENELYEKIDKTIGKILDKIDAQLENGASADYESDLRNLAGVAQTLGSVRMAITNSTPRS